MKSKCLLSRNTASYLERFQAILKEMIEQMSDAKPTQSISGSFIKQMIPHHQAAIEMSQNLLLYTTDIPLQNIALGIISEQKKSIENMMAAYEKCSALNNTPQELTAYQMENDSIIEEMFYEMRSARTDNNLNANFIWEMIPHHRGAVRMSENALKHCLCPELVPILEAIIASQKKGIRQMRQLLRQMRCQ